MGLFSGALSKQPIEFAELLVGKIARQFPPTSEPQLAKKGAMRRLEGVVEHVMADIEKFQKEVRLGWIGKARFGNAVRWKLMERGYSKQFVDAITEGVVKHIATV